MVVNTSKAAMICSSGALGYKAELFLIDAEGTRMDFTDQMRALGLHFSSKFDMELQVQHIVKTLRERFWTLRNLKSNGFSTEELTQVYKTMLRP